MNLAPPPAFEAFERIPLPALVLGFDGNLVAANAAARLLLGTGEEEPSGRPLLDFIHPEDWDEFLLTFKESVAFAGYEHEVQFRLLGGRDLRHVAMRWEADTARPVCFCSLRDVTSERRRDRHLRRIANGLQEAERTAAIGSWELDLERNELYWSAETRRLHGVPRDYVPTAQAALGFYDEEARPLLEEAVARCVREGQAFDLVVGFRNLEGRHLWVRTIARATAEGGRVTRLHGVIQDVTRQHRAELELERARAAAEEASRARSQFLSSMSHEIRTPLNGILGLAQLLLLADPREDQRIDLEAMSFAAQHLLSLLNGVLDLAKLEAGRVELEQIDFRLADLLAGLQASFAQRAREKGLELRVEVTGTVPAALSGDPTRLLQILTNLVGNAIKFTEAGSVRILVSRVELGTDPLLEGAGVDPSAGGDRIGLHFVVEDTGIGIDPEHRANLFREFSQATASITRLHGGSGLGLVLSRSLVERMGGVLEVESELGVGSRFSFVLPFVGQGVATGAERVAAVAAERTAVAAERATAADTERAPEVGTERMAGPGLVRDASAIARGPAVDRPLEGRRILLAEDNSLNVRVARRFLESWGATVIVAEDGVVAIARLGEECFDAALLDLHMPRKGGVEVAEWVRGAAESTLRSLPLVALTAATTPEERRATEAAGMDGFVAKPFSPGELRAVLVGCLDRRTVAA